MKTITHLSYEEAVKALTQEYVSSALKRMQELKRSYPNTLDFCFSADGENIYEGEDKNQQVYIHFYVHCAAAREALGILKTKGFSGRLIYNSVGSPSFFLSFRPNWQETLLNLSFRSPVLFFFAFIFFLMSAPVFLSPLVTLSLAGLTFALWIIVGNQYTLQNLETELYNSLKTGRLSTRLVNPEPIRFYPR